VRGEESRRIRTTARRRRSDEAKEVQEAEESQKVQKGGLQVEEEQKEAQGEVRRQEVGGGKEKCVAKK
jgi:hypothetical protein